MTNSDPSIEDIETLITNQQNELDSTKDEFNRIDCDYAELKRQMEKLYSDKSELARKRDKIKSDITSLERDKASKVRLQLAEQRKLEVEQELAIKGNEIDKLTASAQWREFAFDHQIKGGKQLAVANRGILADKRGLGKTLTALIWADMVQAKKILVICPNDVLSQFEAEIKHWASERSLMTLAGLNKTEREIIYPMIRALDECIITINYEAWRRDTTIIDDLVNAGFDSIICDEAHRIKASSKLTARGVFRVGWAKNKCNSCGAINLNESPFSKTSPRHPPPVAECGLCFSKDLESTIKNFLSMTGTPILNKPQELFSMLHLVDNSIYQSERQFLTDYCFSVTQNKWRFRHNALNKLTERMNGQFLQRDRDSANIHIPPPAVFYHELEKDVSRFPKQWGAYQQLSNAAAMVLEDGRKFSMFSILDMITRQRQCVTWPAGIDFRDPETKEILCSFDVEESQKVTEAGNLIEELIEENERIVIFSQFKAPLYELQKRFPEQVTATGDNTIMHRDAVKQDFDLKTASKDNFRWNACFATYKAFGTGINLNAARHVILLDDEWNPGMQDQAIGRIDRLNSTDQANVHVFRVKDTIDSFMAGLMEEKKRIVEGFEDVINEAELIEGLKSLGN